MARAPCLRQDGTAAMARAYLSNVCVARAVRRRSVARALMAAAEAAAAVAGVRHLYVHVVADNVSAAGLYTGCGFEVEAEEGEAQARALRRPRRKILHKRLGVGGSGGAMANTVRWPGAAARAVQARAVPCGRQMTACH
jgi:hypothetical protein